MRDPIWECAAVRVLEKNLQGHLRETIEFDRLHLDNSDILKAIRFRNGGRIVYSRAMTVFIDFEWYEYGGRNVLLSTQIAVVSADGAKNVIIYTRLGKRLKKGLTPEGYIDATSDALKDRLTLAEIVEIAMRANDGGELVIRKSGETRVILVIHNSVAEWSMLKDRDASTIVKRLTAIRKSPVTAMHPIELRNQRIGKVDLEIFDTRLLLPAGLQSLEKASSLFGEDDKKIDISEFHKRNMHRLLMEDPELFEKYALRDTEVTAKLFFLLQRLLNDLAFGGFDRLFKTLGSSAVKGFLNANPWFEEYREKLQDGEFAKVQPIIRRAYLGGLNMANFRGDSEQFAALKDYIFVDIDFANAYANAYARNALIDVNGVPEVVYAQYQWSSEIEEQLKVENISPSLIRKLCRSVAAGREAVEEVLRGLRHVKRPKVYGEKRQNRLQRRKLLSRVVQRRKRQAKIIRDILLVPNNYHLDRWVDQVNAGGLDHEIPGFASVRFAEPLDVEFTCLPIKKHPFGLVYIREGETVVPAVELVMAVNAGVKVEVLWSVELPVERDAAGKVQLLFFDHLKHLVQERVEAKKNAEHSPVDAAKEQLLKETINAFYGKSAQGLNFRRVYNPSTGEFFPLTESEITEASVAALVTAQVRAALASTLLAIQQYNRSRPDERPIVVVSATTDGLLMGIPCEPGFSVVDDYFTHPTEEELAAGKPPKMKKGVDVRSFLRRFGHEELLDLFYQYSPLQNLRQMRIKLTGNDDFLEIKHLADRIVGVKTRGQIGTVRYRGRMFCTLLARYGHKVPLSILYEDPAVYSSIMKGDRDTADATWLLERIDKALTEKEIERYQFINLTTFREILESGGTLDLVNRVRLRKTNNDWDYKREPVLETPDAVGFLSKPYKDLPSMLRARRQADAIRKSGMPATPQEVTLRLKNRASGIRARSGDQVTLVRQFVRAYVQGVIGGGVSLTETEIAELLNGIWAEFGCQPNKEWKRSDISNARRAQWRPNALIQRSSHLGLLRLLCVELEVDFSFACEVIFAKGVVEKGAVVLAQKVGAALLNGPTHGVDPFRSLSQKGALPGKTELTERLHPFLEGKSVVVGTDFPAPVAPADRPLLRRLFVAAGLDAASAKLCTESLSPPDTSKRKPRRNPSQMKCLELFVTALHQPDIEPGEVEAGTVLKGLKRFGLSRRIYSTARRKVLPPRPLEATPANRKQVELMARALKVEATKFFDVLMEWA